MKTNNGQKSDSRNSKTKQNESLTLSVNKLIDLENLNNCNEEERSRTVGFHHQKNSKQTGRSNNLEQNQKSSSKEGESSDEVYSDDVSSKVTGGAGTNKSGYKVSRYCTML